MRAEVRRRRVVSRLGLVGAAVAALAVFAAPQAAAHGSDPVVHDMVTDLTPAMPGVTFDLEESIVPEMTVTNTSGKDLEILDRNGQPYLRIGPRGAEGNLNAAELYRSNDPSGTAKVPDRTQHNAPPQWTKLGNGPTWAWFDPRVRYDIESAPPEVVRANKNTTLANWQIPVRLGGMTGAVHGMVHFRPGEGAPMANLTSPMQPTSGLMTALTPGSYPDLLVSNNTGRTLTIMGARGEPFARVGPTGTQVNLLSPTHVADVLARHETPQMPANAAAPPRWQQVSSSPTYNWLEQRARPTEQQFERGQQTPNRNQVLVDWTVPATLGTQHMDLRGEVRWIPAVNLAAASAPAARPAAAESSDSPLPMVAGALVAVLIVAGVVVLLRRRSRASRPS